MAQTDRLAAQRLEFEKEKLKCESKLKKQEIDVQEKAQNDEMKLIKRYGDALAQVISSQPEEITDLPAYFRGVEEQFTKLNVPCKYQARLIYKYLSARARTLCSRLEPDVRDDYDRMKNAVLKEYGLTAKCFLERFNTMRKPFNDTFILFTSKLRGLLLQYFNARKVTSFHDVVSLLVSDRVKFSLTEQCLKYVLSVENNLPSDGQQWLGPQRLSEIVDEFVSYTHVSGTRATFIGQTPVAEGRHQSREHGKTVAESKTGSFVPRSIQRDGSKGSSQNQTATMNTFGRKCHNCGSRYHLKGACDKVTEKGEWSAKPTNATTVLYSSTRPGQYSARSPDRQSAVAASPHVPVNRVKFDNRPIGVSVYTVSDVGSGAGWRSADASRPTALTKPTAPTADTALTVTKANSTGDEIPAIHPVSARIDCDAESHVGIESLVSLFDECESPVNDSDDYNNVNVTNVQFDMDRFIADSNVSLHHVNVVVSDDCGKSVEVDSLFDSGTQLSVIREELIEPLQCDVLGEVKLLGFNGNMSTGKVVSLNARMKGHDVTVPVRFVACQHVTQNCLLSLADYRRLMQT